VVSPLNRIPHITHDSNYKRPHIPSGFTPAVTIFKPICGIEQGMDENLRSFCEQDYPEYQIIFGLHGNDDDAIPVIQKIIEDS